ncbi:MAG: acetate--CoA ligase family protein [Roseicyclus sp.]
MARLDRLLKPRSLAVIGGGAWGASVIREARRMGFEGPIWPIHPTRAEVGGEVAYPTPDHLPGVPDASFVAINREATVDMVRRLRDIGAGGAICFASGFREAEAETGNGTALQDALLAAAGDMPFLGPNCYGLLNLVDGVVLWPDVHGAVRCDRGVAILSQSSNIAINLTMQTRGLPVAFVVTVGNQAQTGLAEIGATLLADPRVTALGLYIEGIGDLAAFEVLATVAQAQGKRIVALKAGVSEAAQLATLSHTASLAGSAASASALFARLGVAEVTSLSTLLETLKIFHQGGGLIAPRIAAASCSGGEASLMADTAAPRGVQFPALTQTQASALRAALGPKVALANPLDYHTYIWADVPAMTACFAALLDGPIEMGLLVLDWPRADRGDGAAWDLALDAFAAAVQQTGTRGAVLASLPENLPEACALACLERGLLPLSGIETALDAIAAAATPAMGRPAPIWHGPVPAPGRTLSEAEAKAALAAHGLPIPRSEAALTPEDAAAAAARMGDPVALKGSGVAHKTEAGLVVLGLKTPEAVQMAAQRMNVGAYLVEEMIENVVAELLIGVTRDPAHGLMLTLGAGGQLTEIWHDATHLLLPVTAGDIDAALARLRIAPLLAGYRGKPAADRRAIVAAILAVQDYVGAYRDQVLEVEVNPLLCLPDRAVAADALIQLGERD